MILQSCKLNFWQLALHRLLALQKTTMSRIRGVVASYLASEARDPGIDSHQHQKDS